MWILDLRNYLFVWMNRILFFLNLFGLLFSLDISFFIVFLVYVGFRIIFVVVLIFIMNFIEEIEMIKFRVFYSII